MIDSRTGRGLGVIEGESRGRRKGRGVGSVSLGGGGTVRSIIPTRTLLGFRVRDSTAWQRDKSLLLTLYSCIQ